MSYIQCKHHCKLALVATVDLAYQGPHALGVLTILGKVVMRYAMYCTVAYLPALRYLRSIYVLIELLSLELRK